MRLILASASPRRAELLRAAGFSFEVLATDVDETPRAGELPEDYVRRLAIEKSSTALNACATSTVVHGAAITTRAAQGPSRADCVIVAADTAVVVDGEILGKPIDDGDAARMLRLLSGRWHQVMTGVSVRSALRESGSVEKTEVLFSRLSDAEVDWYVTNGEGRDKAGAYAIQGLASRFIPRIEGSYANVVGLPVALVHELLKPFETRYPEG